jgi:D-sedoheptulose 7-phosphate isomerase
MDSYATRYLDRLRAGLDDTDISCLPEILDLLGEARADGRAVYVLGNGGSAALASHFAADLSRAAPAGTRGLRAHALANNASLVTGWSNDVHYADVFVEQLSTFLHSGDIVIAITCRGNSTNVVEALRLARARGARTVGLLGFDGGDAAGLVDYSLHVRVYDYGLVETVQTAFCHMITDQLARP